MEFVSKNKIKKKIAKEIKRNNKKRMVEELIKKPGFPTIQETELNETFILRENGQFNFFFKVILTFIRIKGCSKLSLHF